MKKTIPCEPCKRTGSMLSGEGKPFPCPYCKGSKKRTIDVPDRSHRMQRKWHSEILAPAGTPRFYSVRACLKCGEEEWQHPAGHFFNGLLDTCVGGTTR